MGIMLGLAAALLYGGSDFSGGVAARRLGPLRVSIIGCLVATVLSWALLGVVGGPGPSVRAAQKALSARKGPIGRSATAANRYPSRTPRDLGTSFTCWPIVLKNAFSGVGLRDSTSRA